MRDYETAKLEAELAFKGKREELLASPDYQAALADSSVEDLIEATRDALDELASSPVAQVHDHIAHARMCVQMAEDIMACVDVSKAETGDSYKGFSACHAVELERPYLP